MMKRAIQKMRQEGIINYRYVMKCPHCQEVFYQITERNPTDLKICDTCGQMYVPTKGISLFDLRDCD
jgi:rRNA maturation endonuclease Nob1